MNWSEARHLGEFLENDYPCVRDRWDLPETWLPMHYFEAMNCLFRIENALRLLVYVSLKREFRENWANIAMSTEDSATANLTAVARKRSNKDDQFEYLTSRLKCPLMYLTAGELVGIIFSESYWKLFRRYFPGAQALMHAKLQEIACIRNALAHFRPVTQEQVKILKENGRQILSKFDKEFKEMLFGKPSDSPVSWTLSILPKCDSPPVTIKCHSGLSKSGNWIILSFHSAAQSVKMTAEADRCHIRFKALDLEKTLRAFPALRQNCIFATHQGRAGRWDGDSAPPPIRKTLRFIFPNPPRNSDSLKGLSFLPPDLLAGGAEHGDSFDLLAEVTVTAKEFETGGAAANWYIPQPEIIGERDESYVLESDFVENWGSSDGTQAEDDPLTDIPKYPWMQSYTAARH